VGELNPKILPEIDAEKWGVLSQTTHRVGKAVFDASLPERLVINEMGGIVGKVGFEATPETPLEKQFFKHRASQLKHNNGG